MPMFRVEVTEYIAQRCTYYILADDHAEAMRNAADGIVHDREIEPDTGRGEGEPINRHVWSAEELPPLPADYDGTF